MTTMLRCLVVLLFSAISLIEAQRTFGGAFDGGDILNTNNAGVDDTLRGFDPSMRIPRFRNRRLGDLPRPLQLEVINSLIANGVRGSRVANGVVNGAGIRTGGVDINTRRFAVNGAQGRGFGVDTFTATGTNGGGVGGRRFTVNNRFGDSLSTTRIGRIPPATGSQTIDLGATRTNGRILGRAGVRTTRLTGGMPRSGILGGLGSNVDDLFLDPVSGRRVLVRPVGVANNIVNQRTNGDGGIGGGVPDIPPVNGFRDMAGGRRFPPPTFAGGPQANFRRQQLPIFPPNGMTGPRATNFNDGFPNDRDNIAGRPPFIPPTGPDAERPLLPPGGPPPGFAPPPGIGRMTFPRQPLMDAPGTRESSRTQQSSDVRSSETSQLPNTWNQNVQQRRMINSQLFGTPSWNTVPQSRSLSNPGSSGTPSFQTAPESRSRSNSLSSRTPSFNTVPESRFLGNTMPFGTPSLNSRSQQQEQQTRNSSVDVQIDDFLSTLDALIAAESAARGIPSSHNSQPISGFTPTNTASVNTQDMARMFNNVPVSSTTLNDFTLPTSLPDPQLRRDRSQWSSTASDVAAHSIFQTRDASQHLNSLTESVHSDSGTLDPRNIVQSNQIGSSPGLSSFGGSALANNGAGNNQINAFSSASQNLNAEIPKQSPQEIRSGALQAVRSIAQTDRANSEGFFLEGQGPTEGSTVLSGDSFIDWSHFNKALQENGFETIMPSRTDINGNVVMVAAATTTTPSPQATPTPGRQSRFR